MRTLILVRHAKAEAPSDGLSDHDRALTLAGRTAAGQLAEELTKAGLAPTHAVVSSAVRAQQTWQLMLPSLGEVSSDTVAEVYETHDEGLQEIIRSAPADADTLVVVGHEPTISAAAAALSGHGSDTRSLQRVAHGLPTGSAAVLEYDGEWSDLEPRSARLVRICSSDVQY